jgi:2'-5' RNA ligase
MRAFLAITLPDDVRASLEALQRDLAQSQADVNWVEPKNLHVTLKFLDEITDGQRQAVEALLARVASDHDPFTVSMEQVGAFPSIGSPHVIWVGLAQGKETVASIAEVIERQGASIPLRREERRFSPHLTLGRVRSSRHQQALVRRLRDLIWEPPAPWLVASLTLYQSVLSPAGPFYTVLADILLSYRSN